MKCSRINTLKNSIVMERISDGIEINARKDIKIKKFIV
jgi:hypothetical protein